MRIRPNQDVPNQVLGNRPSSKYGERIEKKIEPKNFSSDDIYWLGNSWIYYKKVIHGKCLFPTL